MPVSIRFYSDSGLTSPLTSLQVVQSEDGSAAPVDAIVYFGSTATSKKFQAESNPGVASIVLNVDDVAVGSGVNAAHVKLALTAGGLDTAVAGAPLDLGVQRLSGAGNSLAVHVRVDTPALASGVYTDLTLRTNSLIETSV